jgi:hypothetical protein
MGGCRKSSHEKAKDAQKLQEETSSHNGPFSAPWGEGGTSWNQSRENSLRLWPEIANGFFRPSRPSLIPAHTHFPGIPRDDIPTLAIDFAKHLHLRVAKSGCGRRQV